MYKPTPEQEQTNQEQTNQEQTNQAQTNQAQTNQAQTNQAQTNQTKPFKGKSGEKPKSEEKSAKDEPVKDKTQTAGSRDPGSRDPGSRDPGSRDPGSRDPGHRLRAVLKELHLPTVRACYEEAAHSAAQEGLTYERFLLEVLEREREVRHNNRIERLLRESHLPLEKTLENFEITRLPPKARQQVALAREGFFLSKQENLLCFGNPGSGKTHLLCGISQHLIRKGHKVLYTSCALLVQELLIAKRDLTMSRLLRRLASYDALLIDDLGYVQQSREEMEVLFTLLAERYERGSVLITSNLPFSRWESIFKDPMTTAAAIDRLVHHSIILELNIPSYRMQKAQQVTTREPGSAEGEVEVV